MDDVVGEVGDLLGPGEEVVRTSEGMTQFQFGVEALSSRRGAQRHVLHYRVRPNLFQSILSGGRLFFLLAIPNGVAVVEASVLAVDFVGDWSATQSPTSRHELFSKNIIPTYVRIVRRTSDRILQIAKIRYC